MELDNIIYVVLIVALFGISLLGHPRKRKVSAPISGNEETNYSLNDFEKILERKQEYIKEEPGELEEVISEEVIEAPDERAVQEKTSKKTNKKDENEINDGFDIKSAIIYSSILERKKFRH